MHDKARPQTEDSKRQMAIAVAIQLTLAALAYMALRRTPDERLRGPRWLWRVVIPATFTQIKGGDVVIAPAGPLLFFLVGRRRKR